MIWTAHKQERDGASRPISPVTDKTIRLSQPPRRLAPLGSCYTISTRRSVNGYEFFNV
jgi:hypothetical protein